MGDDNIRDEMIKRASAAFRKLISEKQEMENDMREYNKRSRKVGSAFRKKIFDKAIAFSGIEPADIARRQADNDAADLAFFEKLHIRVLKNADKIALRNKGLIENYRKSYGDFGYGTAPPPPGPPPAAPDPVFAILNKADAIDDLMAPGVVRQYAIGPWNNTLKTIIEANQSQDSLFAFEFFWTPPRDGSLNLVSVVGNNGSYWWATQHKCVETLIEQGADIGIYVFDPRLGPESATSLTGQSIFYNYQDDHPGCWTDAGNEILDQPVFLEYSGYAVTGGQPLVFAIVVDFEFSTDEAKGQIDYFNGSKELNVTGLILRLI